MARDGGTLTLSAAAHCKASNSDTVLENYRDKRFSVSRLMRAGGQHSQSSKAHGPLCVYVRGEYVCGREVEVVEGVREVRCGDPEVVLPAESALGLARDAGVERDERPVTFDPWRAQQADLDHARHPLP